MVSYGIDFGTTNSVVCGFNGKNITRFIHTDNLPHPSVIWYRGGKKPIVGRQAKDRIRELGNVHGNQFIRSIKSQIEKEEEFEILGKRYYTWQVASEIFRFLKEDILLRHKDFPPLNEAVVTIPLYFNGRQRRAIRKAAEKAGILIKSFIHEPFAAVVGYLLFNSNEYESLKNQKQNILVFDWGGGTLDITLVKLDSGYLYEVNNYGVAGESGDYFDEILMSDVISTFQKNNNISSQDFRLDKGIESLLSHDTEFAKIELSSKIKSSIQLINFYEDVSKTYSLDQEISRQYFERLIHKTVEGNAMRLVDNVLNQVKISQSQINQVLLIGGTSRIPLLKEKMYQSFGITKVVELENADTIIAEGAAIISHNNWQPYLVRPINVQLCDDSQYVIFDKGTILKSDSAQKEIRLFCNDNTNGEGRLIVTEDLGNNQYKVKKILNIPLSKTLKDIYTERVFVKFQIDENIILQIRGHGSIQNKAICDEINNLCYGLRFI